MRSTGGLLMLNTNTQISFKDIAALWIKKKEASTKESTYVHYYNLLKNHIEPKLGEEIIEDITLLKLEKTAITYSTEGRLDYAGGLSQKTVCDITIIIKSILRYAETLGHSLSCNLESFSVKQPSRKLRVLSHKEQIAINEFLLKQNDFTALGILIALYTGVRIGELCALSIDDFDIDMKKVTISKTMQRLQNKRSCGENKTYIAITTPKTKNSIREIPLPDFIVEKVLSMGYTNGSYILTGLSDKFIEPRTMENRFNRLMRMLFIDDVSFHTLRHTFATRCVEVGVDVKTLSETLGHSNVNITLNRYVHSSFEMRKKSLQKLNYYTH